MSRLSQLPGVELPAKFGEIDIYLFDQLLRGRFDRRPRVLDAGCGEGRNLMYFFRRGFTCFGIDRDPAAIERIRAFAAQLAPALPLENFQTGEIDRLPWVDASVDAVVCSAVLHFAADLAHFDRMCGEMWRVLAPDGMFFARLASNIGIEDLVGAAGRRCGCRTDPTGSWSTKRSCWTRHDGSAGSGWIRSRPPTSSSSAA